MLPPLAGWCFPLCHNKLIGNLSTERYPQKRERLYWHMRSALQTMLKFEPSGSVTSSRKKKEHEFKNRLKESYRQPEKGNLFDMATGKWLRYSLVLPTYIFKKDWKEHLSVHTSLSNIEDPRNGILLYKPVHSVFNEGRLCIEVSTQGDMTFRLLDYTLWDIELANLACQLREEDNAGNQRLPEENDLHITFGDLDGEPLQFPQDTEMRPSKRLLGIHALSSLLQSTDRTNNQIQRLAYNSSEDPQSKETLQYLSDTISTMQKSRGGQELH